MSAEHDDRPTGPVFSRRKVLEETILRMGLEINLEKRKNVVGAPGHS